MAGAAESKISNQPITFELNLDSIARFEFESNLEASQVPTSHSTVAVLWARLHIGVNDNASNVNPPADLLELCSQLAPWQLTCSTVSCATSRISQL